MNSIKQGGRAKDRVEKSRTQAKTGAVMLAIAAAAGILLNFTLLHPLQPAETVVEETPRVTVIPARPSAAPTATPTVTSLKLYNYGTELTADGFTTYVGDKAIVLTAKIEPGMTRPPVFWSVSDSESASLTVSDDRLSCEYTALKPSGRNELTVSCYGAETVIPVYLWKR